jgi:hypothetical protein
MRIRLILMVFDLSDYPANKLGGWRVLGFGL